LGEAAGEELEHFPLAGGQRLDPACAILGTGARSEVPHGATDPREKLAFIERLHDIVVGAEQEPCDAVEWLGSLAGHEDDRDLVPKALAQLSAHLVAAHGGEVDVQEDKRRPLAVRDLEGVSAIVGLDGPPSDPVEKFIDLCSVSWVAVGDEY